MNPLERIWFVDGYHNGPYYGIPPGSWRDIADALDRHPDWKLVLDVEPHSWAELRRHDPRTWSRLLEAMRAPNPRVEIAACLYAQPYCWVIDGESTLRHLVAGRRLTEALLPGVPFETYCIQEPCWTSALPRMLLETGYRRAVLRDPGTAFAGYVRGRNLESFLWQGPDGATIPCVGRYEVDGLVRSWEHESRYAKRGFARRCRLAGISQPVGTGLQDVGWHARPGAPFKPTPDETGEHITFVTWREYFEQIAAPPTEVWRLDQEDFQVTLPWGDQALAAVAGHTRRAELALRRTEKFAMLGWALVGAEYDERALASVQHDVLHCQHHDSWVCARWPRRGLPFFHHVLAQSQIARNSAGIVQEQVLDVLTERLTTPAPELQADTVLVFNSEGASREDWVELDYALPPDQSVDAIDAEGRPLDLQVRRQFPPTYFDHNVNDHAVRLLARVRVPGFGWTTFQIRHGDSRPAARVHLQRSGDRYRVDNGVLAIEVDALRGGSIVSLLDKDTAMEFSRGDPPLGTYRAFLCAQNRFACSSESAAEVRVVEAGPLRVKLEMKGLVGPIPFVQTLAVSAGDRLLDLEVRFDFGDGVELGDPEGVPHVVNFAQERRQSWHDARYKLCLLLPSTLQMRISKDAAFDVCQSAHQDTLFNAWDAIKHHVLLNWLDGFDERRNVGLAVLVDRTSGYVHGQEHPLGLILASGRGESRPIGVETRRFALLPHPGDWREADLWNLAAGWRSPLKARVAGARRASVATGAWLTVETPGVELVSAFVENGIAYLRLFNSGNQPTNARLRLAAPWDHARTVTALGQPGVQLGAGEGVIAVPIAQMAYATLAIDPQTRPGLA
jgi:alpha-mannosidase